MKTIGLIGGITWHSTVDYYRLINEMVHELLGGVSSAKIIVFSVDFAEIKLLTEAGNWDALAELITGIARKLEQSGAACILIGANTMHKIAPDVAQHIGVPLIHVAKETAGAIQRRGLQTVALLGTKYVMQEDFYKNELSAGGLAVLIPSEEDVQYINSAIYNEMGQGLFLPETKGRILQIIEKLVKSGAEGIILGCTEIPILIKQSDCRVPLFDTTYIHAAAAVKYAMS